MPPTGLQQMCGLNFRTMSTFHTSSLNLESWVGVDHWPAPTSVFSVISLLSVKQISIFSAHIPKQM